MDDLHAQAVQQELERLRHRAHHPDTAQELLGYLERHSVPWPGTDLLLCYQSIWKALPEDIKCGKQASRHDIVEQLRARVKQEVPNLVDILPGGDRTAIIDVKNGVDISHEAIQWFVDRFDLGLKGSRHGKPRVVVILPNGPMMALACLAVAARYTLVPMTPTVAAQQLLMDLKQVDPDAIIMLEENLDMVEIDPQIAVFVAQPESDLTFNISCLTPHCSSSGQQSSPNAPDDIAAIFFTSGTSGKKKLVPITSFNLIVSTVLTSRSLGLSANDRCLNMMPLNHIGGIIRSLFGSIVAGGAVICCPSFDPSMFWDAVEQWSPSWYYAAPTMHQMILAESEHRQEAIQASKIRLICNAAAGLPPTVATQLQEVFHCSVFPSYGMTECNPIAAPPLQYRLDRPGTSGIEAGPELAILETIDSPHPVPAGITGRICVRGIPVFPGYLTADGLDRGSFGTAGWFDTGDLGHMDHDGYLFVTGRSKEVINRGGEIISPVEVEDAIFTASKDPESVLFGRIVETLAFSVPHDMLQEVVGVVVVSPQGRTRPDIRQLHEALQGYLPQPRLPMVVVYMDGVPKSNNKIQRLQLSQRLQLDILTDSTLPADCHYEAECPPPNTPLTEIIPSRKCVHPASMLHVSPSQCLSVPDILMRRNKADGFLQAILFFRGQQPVSADDLIAYLRAERHGYLVPSSVKFIDGLLPLDEEGRVVEELVDEAIRQQSPHEGLSAVQERVREVFASARGVSQTMSTHQPTSLLPVGTVSVLAVWYPSCAENSRSTYLVMFCSITAIWVRWVVL